MKSSRQIKLNGANYLPWRDEVVAPGNAARQHCRVSQAITVVEIVLAGVLTMLNEHGRLELREFGSFTLDPGGRKRRRYNIAKKKVFESKAPPRILFRASPCLFERRRGQRPKTLFGEYSS